MQPYNYTIDLPPPAPDTFLQDIMGIQQLKGLRQQQEISQQQAAFQKEMQPYEVQKAQAAIAAQQSALAGSEQSRRQNEILFKQGQENRVREMEQQAVAQAKQNELFGKLSALPPDAPISQILPIVNELTLYKPEAAKQLMANFDNAPKQFQKASETTLVSALNQLNANNIDGAKKTYSDFATAVEGSMGKNPELKALADAAKVQVAALDFSNEEGVNIAKASGLQLLSLINPQAVNAIVGAQETQAKTKTELAKLAPGGEKISDKQQDTINTLTSEAVDARINVAGATDAVTDLLNFAETNPKEFSKGTAASIDKFFLDRFGDTTKAQNLRASVQPFVTKDWMAKAAGIRGALSEKEGARFDKGAPKVETAGPEELLSWLRIVQKVELVDADKKDINAAWQQNARSLQAKAPVEFEVAGIKVKPGDSFQQTVTKVQAGYRKKNQEDILADAARLKRIKDAQKSGRSPAFGRFDVMGAGQQQQPAAAPNQATVSPDRESLLNRYR
jgi:hypothetical protein